MKLERRKVNALTRQLENFKRKKLDEAIELEDKAIIEVPIIMGSQLKDMEKNKEHYDDVMKQNQDAIDEFKKDEEKNIKEAKDKWKGLVSKLEEEFKDLYLKEDNNYTVKCKGRKELRSLIEQCKESNVRYKWEKLIEGDYKYNVKFSLKEDLDDDIVNDEVVVDEQPIQEPTTQPEAINLDNLKLGDAIVVTQNLLDALMQTKQSVEQMADTITNASEPITPNNEQEVFPTEEPVEVEQEVEDEQELEIDESLKLNEKLDLDGLKALLQDYKDGKFELDDLTIDKDGWVVTSDKMYSVEENLQTEEQPKEQINEGLAVVGSLEDYSPSPSAKPLYDEIVAEGMLEDLDKVLREIYQDGASIDELNNLLSTEKDFVRSMLGLDGNSTLEKDIEDETIEEIEKEDSLPASEKEPEKNEYLNDETGYGEEDEDEEDLSSLEAIVDSDEAKDM